MNSGGLNGTHAFSHRSWRQTSNKSFIGLKPGVGAARISGVARGRGAPGKSGLPASGEGERVIAPEPW